MDISVILATYNRSESLKTTLETFLRLSGPPELRWELVVVDNNSTDATREGIETFARKAMFPVRYLFERTQGRAAALNAGIGAVNGHVIAFTDDDVLLHPDWLASLKRAFDEHDCVAVAGRVLPLWRHPKPEWLEMADQQAVVNFDLGDELQEIHFAPLGANCAFRRDVFARYGLFRVDLGVRGDKHTITCDDTEFGGRLSGAGEKIIYCPTAIIYHPVDPLRTTRKYFLDWYYYNGVSLTRTAGLPSEGIYYFGVPRWHYRELVSNFTRWMTSFNSHDRFQQKLKTYRSIGTIVESRRLSCLRNAAQSTASGPNLTRVAPME
jgi:glycosyltransferase involved in cell wall biosynthesis